MKNANIPDATDAALIEGVGNDNYICYNQLFHRYYRPLCRFAYEMLHVRDDAEDVVQELFVRLWENRQKIRISGSVSSYLYTMAKNGALNHIRSANSYRTALEQIDASSHCEDSDMLERHEFRQALRDCIDRLPEQSRRILFMDRMAGLKQKDIAERLHISLQTVKNNIWRSLQTLRKCLEQKDIH